MNSEKIILSSLALDLKRVAQGYARGSNNMAVRFLDEALRRKSEAMTLDLKPYLKSLLKKVGELKNINDLNRRAEDALMYSTLFQNASLVI